MLGCSSLAERSQELTRCSNKARLGKPVSPSWVARWAMAA